MKSSDVMSAMDGWVANRGCGVWHREGIDVAKDPDAMAKLDTWVKSRGIGRYHEDATPPIQQIREELSHLVEAVHAHDMDGDVLEIGLGIWGGTNILWRLLFSGRIVTVEAEQPLVDGFIDREKIGPADNRHFIVGDCHGEGMIQQARELAPYVFLHIDAAHDYDDVRMDYFNYVPMVSPGGMIVMHDLLTPGVGRFVKELEIAGHKINKIIHSEHVGFAWEIKP
jgi:predicted O-methyltransferase YrrM